MSNKPTYIQLKQLRLIAIAAHHSGHLGCHQTNHHCYPLHCHHNWGYTTAITSFSALSTTTATIITSDLPYHTYPLNHHRPIYKPHSPLTTSDPLYHSCPHYINLDLTMSTLNPFSTPNSSSPLPTPRHPQSPITTPTPYHLQPTFTTPTPYHPNTLYNPNPFTTGNPLYHPFTNPNLPSSLQPPFITTDFLLSPLTFFHHHGLPSITTNLLT